MPHRLFFPIAMLAFIAGCSSGADDGTAETETQDTATTAQEMPSLTPGMWSVSAEILDSKIEGSLPGMPANAAEGFASMIGKKDSGNKCMTAEVAKEFMALVNPGADQDKCEIGKMNNQNGQIDIAMTCQKPITNGGPAATVESTVKGQLTADRMNIVINSNSQIQSLKMISSMRISGNRTGDCPVS